MSTISKPDFVIAQLFGLADDLKATIFTSLAAIMSRTSDDVNSNAALAFDHIENMGAKLDNVRNAATKAPSFFEKMKGGFQEYDRRTFSETIGLIDAGISNIEDALRQTLESSTREGADDVGKSAIFLGRAVNAGIELVSGKPLPLPPTFWADFYSETMEQLEADKF